MTQLRLAAYDLERGVTRLPPATTGGWFVWLQEGSGEVDGTHLKAGDAAPVRSRVELAGASRGWLFEAAPTELEHPGAATVLSRTVAPRFGAPRVLRLDRVTAAPGAQTPPHRHRGPGVRRLIDGRILAAQDTALDLIRPGDAWFESGEETVVGTNLEQTTSTFLRMLLLPEELMGGHSSFVPADPDGKAVRNAEVIVLGESLLEA